MILVDIYVPSLDKTYDFQLNEHVVINTVIEEISDMIGQKEHSKVVGGVSNLMLCAPHAAALPIFPSWNFRSACISAENVTVKL